MIDLLNNGQQRKIRIHEDQFGNIIADGLIDAKSTSFEQTMKLLQSGWVTLLASLELVSLNE